MEIGRAVIQKPPIAMVIYTPFPVFGRRVA